MKKFLDLIFLSRPILLIPVYAFIILGYTSKITFTITKPLLVNSFLFSFIMLAIHLSNRITDLDVDRKNKGPGFIDIDFSIWKLNLLIGLIIIFVFVIIFLIDYRYYLIYYFIAVLIGYLYNYKPFYFTGRPIFDFLSNALGYGVIAVILGIKSNGLKIELVKILPFFLFMAAGSIASTTTDVKGDIEAGKITTAVKFGIRNSLLLGLLFLIINLFIGIYIQNLIILLNSIFSIIGFIPAILYPDNKKYLAYSYQIGGGMLIVTAHILCPILFAVSLFLLISTSIYYKFRFNIKYPDLGR